MIVNKKYTDLILYRRILQMARPFWLHIVILFLLSLLSTLLALLSPVPLKIVVDSAIGSEPLPGLLDTLLPAAIPRFAALVLVLSTGLLVAIALLRGLQAMGSSLLRTYTSEKLLLDFRARLFHHVQRLSLLYHDSKGTSDSIYRILYDTSAVQYIAIDGAIPFITATFTFLSMLYITYRIDWQLSLVALAVSPILFITGRMYRERLRSQSRQVKELESAAFSVVQEVLTALRVVKAFGQEDREQDRFVRQSHQGIRARIKFTLAEGGLGLLLGLTTATGTAAVLFIGAHHVQSNTLTLGNLILVMGYLSQLYDPLATISRKVASIQSHLASAERAFTLLDEAPDVSERSNALPLKRTKGALALEDVTFAYDGAEPVLRGISLDVPSGTQLGIAGRTGAGKTTLMSLLTRFYDPTAGRILLDGVDIRNYKLADLRNQFAIVLQEPVLFSTSIAENIAYARPGASEKEIIKAAQAANAHEFIVNIQDGYDTLVGERGMRLSGGERQRIALARAFLKDAPILILDEPTSSVDMRTETGIMEAMERLMHGRTTFLIAHRLTTLENCDVLVVLEDGRLATVTSDVSTTVREAIVLGGLEAAFPRGEVHTQKWR